MVKVAGLYRCYAKSPTVQDAFQPIPSCIPGFMYIPIVLCAVVGEDVR